MAFCTVTSSVNIMVLVWLSVIVLTVDTVSNVISTPLPDNITAQIRPGIKYIALMILWDLPSGISLIVDMISISRDTYVIPPYTRNSIMDISPITLMSMYWVKISMVKAGKNTHAKIIAALWSVLLKVFGRFGHT